MAKSNRKDQTQWGRFRRWAEENQKVVMVVLLLLIAPLFAFTTPIVKQFSSDMEGRVVATVYGDHLTELDVRNTNERLGRALTVIQAAQAYAGFGDSPFLRVLGLFAPRDPEYRDESLMALDGMKFPIYREKARREGLRVTDAELGEHIREIWQWFHAGELAAEEVARQRDPKKNQDQQQFFQERFQILQLAREKKEELGPREFDPDSWAEIVGRTARGEGRSVRLDDFEETIRDLYLIAKLEDRVKSWVQVTPEEAYDEYRKQKQTRLFSWTELAVSDALKEKLDKDLTPEAIKEYYAANQQGTPRAPGPFHRPASLRVEWLLLPKGHFEEEAKKKVTDVELKDYYEKNKNDFRKSAILGSEAEFAPRTTEQKKQHEESLFKPFEEVRDQVLEKVIAQNSRSYLDSFAGELRQRLYPVKGATGETPRAATFAEVVKDHPFLKTGTSGYVSRDQAKTTLGDAYAPAVVSWFSQIESPRPGSNLDPSPAGYPVDAGKVFYRKPETRQAGVPPLRDLESDVRSRLVKEKALQLIEKAAGSVVEDLNAGKTDLEKVAASGLDVPVVPVPASASPGNPAPAPAENVHLAATPVASSKRHLGRQESLMVPKKEEPKKDEKAADKKEEDEAETPSEEPHASSGKLLEVTFKIAEKGKTAVGTDLEQGSAYLVRVDDLLYPDASGFEASRELMERKLLEGDRDPARLELGKLRHYFSKWRNQVFVEATGEKPAADVEKDTETAPPKA